MSPKFGLVLQEFDNNIEGRKCMVQVTVLNNLRVCLIDQAFKGSIPVIVSQGVAIKYWWLGSWKTRKV